MRSNISETLCWQGGVTLDGKRYALFSNAGHQLRIMEMVDFDNGGEWHEMLEPVAEAQLIARIKSK